jgi:hypothetical protein
MENNLIQFEDNVIIVQYLNLSVLFLILKSKRYELVKILNLNHLFRPFGSGCITAVFHRIANDRKRSDTRLSDRLRSS